jgi:NAD(P)-dependent dehydrogenase (short-subunit alcohol dehydrogenase family)
MDNGGYSLIPCWEGDRPTKQKKPITARFARSRNRREALRRSGAAYTAAKHALVGLTRNTAWMYAAKGIRCNAICPGATKTHISETMPAERLDAAGAQRAQAFAALAPAYLEPGDIAALALFLASDDARSINGAIVPADAGWAAV